MKTNLMLLKYFTIIIMRNNNNNNQNYCDNSLQIYFITI